MGVLHLAFHRDKSIKLTLQIRKVSFSYLILLFTRLFHVPEIGHGTA